MDTTKQTTDTSRSSKLMTWVKRMGVGAFLFFLIKGLVWLAIFFGLFKYIM